MKKLGLVGGMGPESTIPYYHDIVYGVQKKLGRNEFPPLTVESVDVFQVLGLCGQGRYQELEDYMVDAVLHLEAAGAQFAALSSNTSHLVFDGVQRRVHIPLLSILDAACAEAQKHGLTRVALLGTSFTMRDDFFKKPFRKAGIEIVTPTEDEMDFVGSHIAGELELGIVKEETLRAFQQILERMRVQEGVEAVILGCTELPLLLNDSVTPVPCLDTVQIHVAAIVDEILK